MPNLTKAQVIQNLNALQFKIANDAHTRAVFLKDPAELLAVTGLALSPDGRYLLFTQVDYMGQDLMLVENFK